MRVKQLGRQCNITFPTTCKREIGSKLVLCLCCCVLASWLLLLPPSLPPSLVLCRYRLYRDACMALEGNYLKDLNVLGRDLSKVAIVDNSPYAYGFQVKKGVLATPRELVLYMAVPFRVV